MAIQEVSKDNFETGVLGATGLIVVDFWATWCGPCESAGEVLEVIYEKRKDELSIFKLDVDEMPDLADKYDIHSVPTLVFFRNGEECGREVGVLSVDALDTIVARLLVVPTGGGDTPS